MEVCHAPLRYTCMYLDVYILFFFKEWYQYAGLFPLLCIWSVFLFLVDSGSQHRQHRPRPDVLGGDGCVRSHAGSRAETRERLFTCQREKQGRNHTREIIKDPQDLRNKITEVYVTDSYAIESWLNYSPMGICIQSIFWNFIWWNIFYYDYINYLHRPFPFYIFYSNGNICFLTVFQNVFIPVLR